MRNHEWRDSSARLEESLMDLVSTASVGPLADKRKGVASMQAAGDRK